MTPPQQNAPLQPPPCGILRRMAAAAMRLFRDQSGGASAARTEQSLSRARHGLQKAYFGPDAR